MTHDESGGTPRTHGGSAAGKGKSVDPVHRAFLSRATVDVSAINEASDVVELVPVEGSGVPPRSYEGIFRNIEHFERLSNGEIAATATPVRFGLTFEDDYLRSTDPKLQFRVARVHTPLIHPNVSGGLVCLGEGFQPGTSLRGLVDHLYRIVAGRARATDHALDPEGQRYFLDNPEAVAGLRAQPLWRRPLMREGRVETAPPAPAAGS
jgi:hypothetical protein